jgi:hypothetical protein
VVAYVLKRIEKYTLKMQKWAINFMGAARIFFSVSLGLDRQGGVVQPEYLRAELYLLPFVVIYCSR